MFFARRHARRTLHALAARVRLYEETGALAWYLAGMTGDGCPQARPGAALLVEEPHQRVRAAATLAALTRLAARRGVTVERSPSPAPPGPDRVAWWDGRHVLVHEGAHATAVAQGVATALMEDALFRAGAETRHGPAVGVVARLAAHVLQDRLGLANPNTAPVLSFMGIDAATVAAAADAVAPLVADAVRDARAEAGRWGGWPPGVLVSRLRRPCAAAPGDGPRP